MRPRAARMSSHGPWMAISSVCREKSSSSSSIAFPSSDAAVGGGATAPPGDVPMVSEFQDSTVCPVDSGGSAPTGVVVVVAGAPSALPRSSLFSSASGERRAGSSAAWVR